MMSEKEFDLDFDFEKEYGITLPPEDGELPIDEEFDLDAILAEDFGSDADDLPGEYAPDFDYGPVADPEEAPAQTEQISLEDLVLNEETPQEEASESEAEPAAKEPKGPAFTEQVKAIFGALLLKAGELKDKLLASRKAPEAVPAPEEPAPDGRTRRPVSPMRKFKNETLPLIILGVTAVLILTFVVGSTSRAIAQRKLNKEAALQASEEANLAAQLEAAEAADLLARAKVLAAGYDYEGAVSLLNTFSGSTSKHPEIDQAKADYTMAESQLVEVADLDKIPNLSFHVLIADPARAYADSNYASSYKKNFVTTAEFEAILQELYDNGFILVDMDDIVSATTVDDKTTYSFNTLKLPADKTPIMLTETLVNYFSYMVDSDGNGDADANGAGFASRLVVNSAGDIEAEYVDADGTTLEGNYDLVPILEDFIAQHPDFSYRGARATLAVCGYDGIFGYRINSEVIEARGQDYYDQQVAGAQELVSVLREKGYTIACNTYRNKNYGDISADQIQADLDSWNKDIVSVIGDVNTLVYAQGSDISTTGDYTSSKFTVLQNEGFTHFITAGNRPSATAAEGYVRQVRLMVTGAQMVNAASTYADYFDAAAVLDPARG